MTPYDPRQWTSHLLDIEGSMVREILGRVFVTVVWSTIVVVIYLYGPEYCKQLSISSMAHAFVGTVLGLLLVFRTNSAYDRYWEARKLWGGIVNETRNLTRQSTVWLAADQTLVKEVINWTIAFPFATLRRIRNSTGIGTTLRCLPLSEVQRVDAAEHVPLAVAIALTSRFESARKRGLIDGLQLASLDQNVQLLVDYCGACERIRNTPIPFAYAVHLRRVLLVYCLTIPFALVKEFGWITILASFLISFSLFGIEEIGVEIEDPFGTTTNDVPIQAISEAIEKTLRAVEEGGDIHSV